MNELRDVPDVKVREALDVVLTFHLPSDPRCRACFETWPCQTVEKIREVLA